MRLTHVLAISFIGAFASLSTACVVGTGESDSDAEIESTAAESKDTESPPGGGSCITNGHLALYISSHDITKAHAQTLCNAACCSHHCTVIKDGNSIYQGWCTGP